MIAIAIAVFVVLVSAQVFRDWPIAALGRRRRDRRGLGGAAGRRRRRRCRGEGVPAAPAQPRAVARQLGATAAQAGARDGGSRRGSGVGIDPRRPGSTEPVADTGGAAGGQGGLAPPALRRLRAAPAPLASPGGSTGSASSRRRRAAAAVVPATKAAAARGGAGGAAPSPSGQVTETVNNTVTKVDETALGGTLGNSGVTDVTEGVVNGVAGPESTVGKVVDEAVGAVGGLLGGKR